MKKMLLVAVAVLLALSVAPAGASPILDFAVIAPTSGSISYAGGAAPLVGTGIQVDNVSALDTPLNANMLLNVLGGVLNFVTGDLIAAEPNGYAFSGGGVITLTGGVDLNGNGQYDVGEIPLGTTLMVGSFDSAYVLAFAGGPFKIAGSAFTDRKNLALITYYGLGAFANVDWSGNFNISFNAVSSQPVATGAALGGFTSSDVLSGDITNTPAVPEPGSMLLLGTGLFGLAAAARRRMKK